jgi:signal transduction histidine kinase
MTSVPSAERALDELTLGKGVVLEDLVDRQALHEMTKSAHALFGVSIRVFAESGAMLADASHAPELYTYLDGFNAGKAALGVVVHQVKSVDPGLGHVLCPCVSGASYLVAGIAYDGRLLGRLILGPYAVPGAKPSKELAAFDPDIDASVVERTFAALPQKNDVEVERAARHLVKTLDLILFSGHKALLTSNMHLASVRESFRELTEKNQKLQNAYDRLKELDRLKSNFLATVSHELRTPLTSIIGYSEMLAEGIAGDLNPEQKEFVTTIHEKGEQLLELIKGLLDLSKLESGTMSLRKAEIEVAPLIADVASTLAPTARKRKIEIDVKVENGLPGLWADAERLRQVLLNLTENAIKFTPPEGKVRLSASLTLLERKTDDDGRGVVLFSNRRPAVELRVTDTGIGIPDAEKQKVFDAFYQVDGSSTREHGGTGLGLSIVRRLVDAHDGVVHVEDNKPQGAVFVVTIPCRRTTVG